MLLNDQWVNDKSQTRNKKKKYLETNENGNEAYQNL